MCFCSKDAWQADLSNSLDFLLYWHIFLAHSVYTLWACASPLSASEFRIKQHFFRIKQNFPLFKKQEMWCNVKNLRILPTAQTCGKTPYGGRRTMPPSPLPYGSFQPSACIYSTMPKRNNALHYISC